MGFLCFFLFIIFAIFVVVFPVGKSSSSMDWLESLELTFSITLKSFSSDFSTGKSNFLSSSALELSFFSFLLSLLELLLMAFFITLLRFSANVKSSLLDELDDLCSTSIIDEAELLLLVDDLRSG